jgi:hypothetical protein
MKRNESVEKSSNMSLWRVVGGATVILGIVGLVTLAPDIKRYIRMVKM